MAVNEFEQLNRLDVQIMINDRVSPLHERIRELEQQVALLEGRINKIESKGDKKRHLPVSLQNKFRL